MYLANVFINNEALSEYMIQIWDMDSKQEKIILYLEHEELQENLDITTTVINAVYDKYNFRIVSAIVINPEQMAIDQESFDELLDEAYENDLLFDLTAVNKSKN